MKVNLFKQFLYSLYDFKKVSAFRMQKMGRTIAYIFLFMLIVSIPFALSYSIQTSSALNKIQTTNFTDIPDFAIQEEKLQAEEQYVGDYFVVKPESDETIASVQETLDEGIVLLEDKALLITKVLSFEFPYTAFGSDNMTKDEIIQFIDDINTNKYFIISIYLLIYYVFSTGVKFIEITLLALIGLFIKSRLKKNIQYRHVWILTAYAITLPSLIISFIDGIQLSIPYAGVAFWALGSFLLYKIISYIPTPKKYD
ncbi:ABC-type multidrug transport system fused ATPase/permease subunit [Salirhabdus euzebyi]|uniref:ABC-type multidrug transport system fused ATPase/permease subunit n=1 Tax=Salirhabdus euzebyi TaxID=394506 RepID=A0A841Q7A8_9BACI|nr:DUF1189 domain-containing protein [Salirhabdus euzebyi]MBB6454288.1 ABC-type multidrug transport system fused ATPase/permease subunit [Salirhabdus euzebyi]